MALMYGHNDDAIVWCITVSDTIIAITTEPDRLSISFENASSHSI